MQEHIHKTITLEGWMDRQLAGENPSQRDLDVIATIVESEGGKKIRIYSCAPLDERARRRWWGHVRDRFPPEVGIEYSAEQADYKRFQQLWVEDYDKAKAEWDSKKPGI